MNKRMNTLIVLVGFVAGMIGGQVGSANAHRGDISLIHACVKDKAGDGDGLAWSLLLAF